MPTFDGENLTITLDSGVTEVDIKTDVYSPWKDWLLESPRNRRHSQAFRSDGGNPLSSIINQGAYIFLNNEAGWRIKPPEENITIYLTGNLAVEDTALPAFVPTDGAFTAAILGLQPVTQGVTPVMAGQLRHSAFNGGVWVDEINGGTILSIGLEAGTEKFPLDNFEDGLAISDEEGFNTFYIIGDATIDSGLDYTDRAFVGQGQNLSVLTITSAAIVLNCSFSQAQVTGTLDGDSHLEGCIIDNLSYISGVIEGCTLNSGTITLGGSQTAHFINCQSGVTGTPLPTIDMGGSGQALALRNYNGGIKLTNKTGTDQVSIDLNSGTVELDETVTNGTILIRGVGRVIDDSIGATVIDETINSTNVANKTLGAVAFPIS